MEIDKKIYAPIVIDGGRHKEADEATKLAKLAALNGLDRSQFMLFLIDHMELEKRNAELFKRHENITYSPKSKTGAEIRHEAYRTMIDRMLVTPIQ